MKNYNPFRENDLLKSNSFSLKLNISPDALKNIEEWFEVLLTEYLKANNFEKQLETEKELEGKFFAIIENNNYQDYKFIFGKLLYYSNIFESGHLRNLYIPRLSYLLRETLIPKIFEKIKKEFSVAEFLSLTEYIKVNYYVSPNAELLEYALKLEKCSKIYGFSDSRNRLQILKNLLEIIKSKDYHHNIICFKKTLELITEGDIEVIALLKEFRVSNKQGCYNMISTILNFHLYNDVFKDLEIKRDIIFLFDTSRGANPNEKWIEKSKSLELQVLTENYNKLTKEIKKLAGQKQFQLDKHTIWTDDVAGRFLKSIDWIEQYK